MKNTVLAKQLQQKVNRLSGEHCFSVLNRLLETHFLHVSKRQGQNQPCLAAGVAALWQD